MKKILFAFGLALSLTTFAENRFYSSVNIPEGGYRFSYQGGSVSPQQNRGRTPTYSTQNNYGRTNTTTNNYGHQNSTYNNYGTANSTTNNYGSANATYNNYGTGNLTINQHGTGSIQVNTPPKR